MIVFKTIKPSPFKSSVFRDEVRREAELVRDDIFMDYDKTTETWKHKPIFGAGVTVKGQEISIEVKTDDVIYGYIEKGTRPHIIRPRRARVLRFWSQHTPKTKPRFIGSQFGGVGGKLLYRPEVHHPGTEAREFSKVIKKKWQPLFRTRMQAALNRAAKKSGHKI